MSTANSIISKLEFVRDFSEKINTANWIIRKINNTRTIIRDYTKDRNYEIYYFKDMSCLMLDWKNKIVKEF